MFDGLKALNAKISKIYSEFLVYEDFEKMAEGDAGDAEEIRGHGRRPFRRRASPDVPGQREGRRYRRSDP